MVSKESIKLYALFEIFYGFNASNLFEEIEVSIYIDASSDKSVPMNTLDLDVCIILLELEVYSFIEVYVWSLDCVHISS